MGRGRAKAKQTKVARQLKYNSPDMDLESLQRELNSQRKEDTRTEDDDPYAAWADYDPDADDDSEDGK